MGEWKVAKLSSLAAINYGYTESASAAPIGPRFLRITDIQNEGVDWLSVPFCPIDAADLRKFRLAHNDIVFARTGATTGKSFLVQDPPEAVFASYLIRLRLRTDELLPSFVNLFFQTAEYWRSIAAGSTGSAQGGFNASKLGDLAIRFPSVASQLRIVAILDEAFAGIATAKANAEKNWQNARELFESRVKSTFANPGEGWVKCTLGSVCELYQPKTITGKDLVADGPYPVFGANGVIGRYAGYNHEEAEVLVTCRGATCGAINVSEPRSWVTGNAMVVRPLDGSLSKSFLEHLLRNGVDLSLAITGAAQPQITRTNLSPLMISFPKSVNEQRSLSAAFDELQSAADCLQEVYSRKLAALDELKKSLLHQAFTGALTQKSTDQQVAEVA